MFFFQSNFAYCMDVLVPETIIRMYTEDHCVDYDTVRYKVIIKVIYSCMIVLG
jgi:hypothetical protein